MKITAFLIFFICCGFFAPASTLPLTKIIQQPVKKNHQDFTRALVKHFISLSPSQVEKLTGKKLRLKDKIALKIKQWKLKKYFADGEPTEKQKKQGLLSLIFGGAGLLLMFIFLPVGLGLSIAGLILGIKSIKGNSNVPGIIGIVLSSLSMLLFLLALVVVAAWIGFW